MTLLISQFSDWSRRSLVGLLTDNVGMELEIIAFCQLRMRRMQETAIHTRSILPGYGKERNRRTRCLSECVIPALGYHRQPQSYNISLSISMTHLINSAAASFTLFKLAKSRGRNNAFFPVILSNSKITLSARSLLRQAIYTFA